VVWNRSRKRDDWRQINQRPRSVEEHVRVERKDLQIIDSDLWKRVASRRAEVEGRAIRFESGRISGRPPKNSVQNLLAGIATCGVCGGGLVVETSRRKNSRLAEYICARHRQNGSCSNALRIRIEDMNEAVLEAVEEHALTPEAIEKVIMMTERDDQRERQDALEAELKDTERRIDRLTDVVATDAGDVGSLVAKLRQLEQHRTVLTEQMKALQPVPRLPASIVENRLAEWRRLLRQSVTQGRAVLQRVLDGRIVFTPDGPGYTFSAPTRFDKLFTGIATPRPAFIETGKLYGAENIRPDETLDADYGLLLERAYGKTKLQKGVASPTAVAHFPHVVGRVVPRAA
jgi:septal ring factor EnvC (AmiA/AmiB activator)